MNTVFKIAGIPVGPLTRGQSLSWELAYGVDPVSRFFTLPVDTVEAIKAQNALFNGRDPEGERQAGSLTLSERRRALPEGGIDLEVGQDKFSRLRLLREVDEYQPGYKTVEITDVRWWLRYTHVERSYNVRKRGPNRRLIGNNLDEVVKGIRSPAGVSNVQDYVYRLETLIGGQPWTMTQILFDVLEEIMGPGNFIIDGFSFAVDPVFPDLEINADGRTALLQVQAYLPQVRFYVNPAGQLVATYALETEPLISKLQEVNSKKEDGAWSIADRSGERPSSYRVYFDRLIEMRFDYGRYPESQTIKPEGEEQPALENVIENPFLELTLPDGRRASLGEYVKYEDFIQAAYNRTDAPAEARSAGLISDHGVRSWITGKWSAYSAQMRDVNTQQPAPQWAAFASNIRRDFRQCFRLTPRWRDKVRSISAFLVATVDRENAVRAKAPVYTQYIRKLAYYVLPGGQPGKAKQIDAGFTKDDWAVDLSTTERSPFEIQVIDPQEGVFRINQRLPPAGHIDRFQVGTPDNLPKVGVLDLQKLWADVILEEDYKVAVILTIEPSVPNGVGRLKAIDVDVEKAAERLGVSSAPGTAGIHEVYTDLRKAKYAWRDFREDQIKDLVWFGVESSNVTAVSLLNEEDLLDIAETVAARELAIKLDLPVGDVTVPYMRIEPQGTLSRVIHTVSSGETAGGKINTRLIMEDPAPPRNLVSLLSQTTRDKIRRTPTND